MLPKQLVIAIVIVVTGVWVVAAVADIFTDYDASGVHFIFGGIVGGLLGLAKRDNTGGGTP